MAMCKRAMAIMMAFGVILVLTVSSVCCTEKTETESTEEKSESSSMFSVVDYIIFSLIAVAALYWFVLRKKATVELPAIKKLTVIPASGRTSDPNFVNKMKNSKRNVVVFYGSQTGTAEEFASRLAKDCVRYGMKGMVADPEECEMEDFTQLHEIEKPLAIFCMATYGEGDPTDNAQEFYDWLQQGDTSLSGLNYAVFGLGNKTYEHYNAMATFVDKKLEELGATRMYEAGLGDDASNIEEDFVTWKEGFWTAVCEHFGIEATGEDVSIRQYSLTVVDELPKEKIFTGEAARLGSFRSQKPPYDIKNPYLAPITVNRELHKGGERSCMHIELDIAGTRIRYDAGDHVAIYPVNDPEIVEAIGNRLKVDLDVVISLKNVDEEASKKHPFPCPCSYRTALSHYLDITSTPRTHVLKELSEYATDAKDKEFLLKMTTSTTEAKALYSDWVVKNHRTILAILEDLPSIAVPLDHICELLPRLQARYYSISSSPKKHPSSIHVTAVLVNYETQTGRTAKGVATTWLSMKHPTNGLKPTVPIFVRKSQFRLPFKASTPVIMIGPGTGLAPFRGFLQDRHKAKEDGKPVGNTILYYGCRKKAEDYIYQEELETYLADGTLTTLHIAFSRDQEHKVYVQHLMKQNKREIYDVLQNGGHIYICGDARSMARDVHDMLRDVQIEVGNKNEQEAEDYVRQLGQKGRYSADVWS